MAAEKGHVMAVPARYARVFGPLLQPGETLWAAANADLWFRYRRLALTDRRLLVVERGGVRHPRGRVDKISVPLTDIAAARMRRGRLVAHLEVDLVGGRRLAYALPSFSPGTPRFLAAVREAAATAGPRGG